MLCHTQSTDKDVFDKIENMTETFEHAKSNAKFSRRKSLMMNSVTAEKFEFEAVCLFLSHNLDFNKYPT